MVQAARSGRQNIAEGNQASAKTELKLVGVTRASLEELWLDYEDFLRQRGLKLWPKNDPIARRVRSLAYEKNRSYLTYKSYIEHSSAETAENCNLFDSSNQLSAGPTTAELEKSFLDEGGFTERLYRARTIARKGKQK